MPNCGTDHTTLLKSTPSAPNTSLANASNVIGWFSTDCVIVSLAAVGPSSLMAIVSVSVAVSPSLSSTTTVKLSNTWSATPRSPGGGALVVLVCVSVLSLSVYDQLYEPALFVTVSTPSDVVTVPPVVTSMPLISSVPGVSPPNPTVITPVVVSDGSLSSAGSATSPEPAERPFSSTTPSVTDTVGLEFRLQLDRDRCIGEVAVTVLDPVTDSLLAAGTRQRRIGEQPGARIEGQRAKLRCRPHHLAEIDPVGAERIVGKRIEGDRLVLRRLRHGIIACRRRIVVERHGQRVAGDGRSVRIRIHITKVHRRVGRLVVRTAGMQHVVQQRHLERTRRLVGDLHREQVGVQTRRIRRRRDLRRQHIAGKRVRHCLKPNRRRHAIQRSRKLEAVRTGAIKPTLPPSVPVNVFSLVSSGSSLRLASRSPTVLAALPPVSPSSSTDAAADPPAGWLASVTAKAIVRRRRVAVAVLDRVGRVDRHRAPPLLTAASAANEYEPSAFTLIRPAPMSMTCEKPSPPKMRMCR